MIDKDKIAELRRLEAEEIQEKVARHLCKLMDDEWRIGRKLYMDTAKEILDDIALTELLRALEALQQIEGAACDGLEDGGYREALIEIRYAARKALPPHGGVDVG